MYNADPNLLEKFNNSLQTEANNNDPRPLVYITRNKTAITSQRYWEKTLITGIVGTRSSVAVRRPKGSLLADMIFVAQVELGDAVIRYAEPKTKLTDMEWTELTTIPNVSELSIMFDGYMTKHDDIVEAYTVGELPYVFYVDASNSLKYINLDDESISGTISDNAVNVASVRGLYSETADLDDGIWCFYTNALGELWEAKVFGGVVMELTQITQKPDGVTAWEDVWAGLSFDYRILLQLKGDDGVVYTLPSKSRPGGHSNIEYLRLTNAKALGKIGLEEPQFLYAEQVPISGDWGKKIRVVFDHDLYNLSEAHTEFRLIEDRYGTYVYPINITQGMDRNELNLIFEDFNQIVTPATLEFFGGKLSGIDFPVSPFTTEMDLKNLNRYSGSERLKIANAGAAGEIVVGFDGKAYFNEHIQIANAGATGEIIKITHWSGHAAECLRITNAKASGVYADANGVPVG